MGEWWVTIRGERLTPSETERGAAHRIPYNLQATVRAPNPRAALDSVLEQWGLSAEGLIRIHVQDHPDGGPK